MTGKQLIRQLFSGAELPRMPFVPWIFLHAARLEQIPISKLADTDHLAKALQTAQNLYGHDAIVSSFDAALEAEACGCCVRLSEDDALSLVISRPLQGRDPGEWDATDLETKGRLPATIEAMRRMKIVLKDSVAFVAVITGPLTLANQLTGTDIVRDLQESPDSAREILKFAAQVCVRVCTAYCKLQPDVVALVDREFSRLPAQHYPMIVSACKPIFGVAQYFNAYSLLVTSLGTGESVDKLLRFPVNGLALGGQLDIAELKALAGRSRLALGVGIPLSVIDGTEEEAREFLARLREAGLSKKLFLTTEWQVPYNLPPEKMHGLVRLIRNGYSALPSQLLPISR